MNFGLLLLRETTCHMCMYIYICIYIYIYYNNNLLLVLLLLIMCIYMIIIYITYIYHIIYHISYVVSKWCPDAFKTSKKVFLHISKNQVMPCHAMPFPGTFLLLSRYGMPWLSDPPSGLPTTWRLAPFFHHWHIADIAASGSSSLTLVFGIDVWHIFDIYLTYIWHIFDMCK